MSGTVSISVEHNFETAHRLPFLGGKCENLHGHSWKVEITFVAYQHATGMNENGISTDYGQLKAVVRTWIDNYLDHGCMLGVKDPLTPVLLAEDSKLFVFGDVSYLATAEHRRSAGKATWIEPAEARVYETMPWPTVEAVARMIAERIQAEVDEAFNDTLWVDQVRITETATNKAVWTPSGEEDNRRARKLEQGYTDPLLNANTATADALRGEDVHP